MLIKRSRLIQIPGSEITPQHLVESRRLFMHQLAAGALTASSFATNALSAENTRPRLSATPNPAFTAKDAPTKFDDASSYNNFYEFGVEKGDPIANSGAFEVDPWSVTIEGEVDKPGIYNLEDILKPHDLQERIYRLRCVERWSMVIPWVGFPLADLIKQFQPNSKAKYVQFFTLFEPSQMPGQRSRFGTITWPYREGLRIDEAVHPLTFLAVGVYGNYLPPQNGAPIRLVVPWKYGFKSIKSIVKIRFTETEPETSWNMLAPTEYGFYANVNPEVHHPRWRQDMETRLPQSLFSASRTQTELFNGYGEQVASLYSGMDLKKFY